jgi:hypothetical protein
MPVETTITPRYAVEIGAVRFCYSDSQATTENMACRINSNLAPLTRKADLCGRMADKLALILPMAKGYAAEHPVGSNQKYVELAEEVKAEFDREA